MIRLRKSKNSSPSVEIVAPRDGWILERMCEELVRRLDYCRASEQPTGVLPIGYYMNYALSPPTKVFATELAFFTHIEESDPNRRKQFFSIASKVDIAVCQSTRYKHALNEHLPHLATEVISPGVDTDVFKPRPLRIGVVGRNYDYTPRKGDRLLREIWGTDGIEFAVTGSGWSVPHQHLPEEELPRFYQSLDYLLITSLWEGGPMCALEALATGIPIIAPPVGWVPDLPHMEYPTGDAKALRAVLENCVQERTKLREAVINRGWDEFARQHDRVFRALMAQPPTTQRREA